MYELEAKAKLSRADLRRLQKLLPTIAKKVKQQRKKDVYFADPKEHFIRTREKARQSYFNLKNKDLQRGVEANLEIELPIKSATKFAKLLQSIGIKPGFRKQKQTTLYKKGPFKIELNHVVGLGDYLEIETMCESKAEVKTMTKKLHEQFRELGFSPKDFEPRYYIDLLTEKRKNTKAKSQK